MSVESNMIILRTHVIFQKLSQIFKAFLKFKLNKNSIEQH